jgi:hypothetical protein
VPPLTFAEAWYDRHRQRLVADMDRALALMDACHAGSGFDALQALSNEKFRPHPALKPCWNGLPNARPMPAHGPRPARRWRFTHNGPRRTRSRAAVAVVHRRGRGLTSA